MVAIAAHVAQMVPTEVESLAREQLLRTLLRERGPLELEEQQRRLNRRLLLLHPLQQRAVGGVDGIGREAQGGVVAAASDQLIDRRELVHRHAQAGWVLLVQPVELARGAREI